MPKPRFLLAVDPSLVCSGWALFGISDGRLRAVGKVRSAPASTPLPLRLRGLQDRIADLFTQLELGSADVLICEAPTTMRDPKAAIKVEQARGIFESVARTLRLQVPGRIHPRTVHHELLGAVGRQLERKVIKEMAVRTATTLFSKDLKALGFETSLEELSRHQDIIDATLIGHVALGKLERARMAKVTMESVLCSESESQQSRRSGWRV